MPSHSFSVRCDGSDMMTGASIRARHDVNRFHSIRCTPIESVARHTLDGTYTKTTVGRPGSGRRGDAIDKFCNAGEAIVGIDAWHDGNRVIDRLGFKCKKLHTGEDRMLPPSGRGGRRNDEVRPSVSIAISTERRTSSSRDDAASQIWAPFPPPPPRDAVRPRAVQT